MKLDGLDHPKTLDLCARLDKDLPSVIGHLELLWAFTAQKAHRGDIGKWPDGAIARSAHWNGNATEFVKALTDAGFLDHSDQHRLLVHDWPDHCPRWVTSKLTRSGDDFAENNCSAECSSECSPHSTQDSSADSLRAGTPSLVNTLPNGNGGVPPSAKEIIWSTGVRLLVDAGESEKQARSMLGRLAKQSEEKLVSAILYLDEHPKADPKSYLAGAAGERKRRVAV